MPPSQPTALQPLQRTLTNPLPYCRSCISSENTIHNVRPNGGTRSEDRCAHISQPTHPPHPHPQPLPIPNPSTRKYRQGLKPTRIPHLLPKLLPLLTHFPPWPSSYRPRTALTNLQRRIPITGLLLIHHVHITSRKDPLRLTPLVPPLRPVGIHPLRHQHAVVRLQRQVAGVGGRIGVKSGGGCKWWRLHYGDGGGGVGRRWGHQGRGVGRWGRVEGVLLFRQAGVSELVGGWLNLGGGLMRQWRLREGYW